MSCVRQRFLSTPITTPITILSNIYQVLYLDRYPNVNEYDKRFYNDPNTPGEPDYEFNQTLIDHIIDFSYDSQVEDIISKTTIDFIKSFRINPELGLDILFAQFAHLNSLLARVFQNYDYLTQKTGKSITIDDSIRDLQTDIVRPFSNVPTTASKEIRYVRRQIEQLRNICHDSKSWSEKFSWLITASYQLLDTYSFDIGSTRKQKWVSVLLFHDREYIGSVNVYDDPTNDRLVMIGIKGSLYKIMGRSCDKGDTDIASKILEAVKMYAIERKRKHIMVIGPIGPMPKILASKGFTVTSGPRLGFNKDYEISLYNPDGSIKVFSDIKLNNIDVY